jgi:hypothetical protein
METRKIDRRMKNNTRRGASGGKLVNPVYVAGYFSGNT